MEQKKIKLQAAPENSQERIGQSSQTNWKGGQIESSSNQVTIVTRSLGFYLQKDGNQKGFPEQIPLQNDVVKCCRVA